MPLARIATGLLVVALLAVGPGAAAAPAARGAAYRPGVVLVGFRAGVPAATQRTIQSSLGGHGAMVRLRAPGGASLTRLRVPPSRLRATIRALRNDPRVRYAEPDYLLHESATPNDPSFSLQWGSRNTGQLVNGVSGTPGADDRAPAAWGVTTGSPSVVIGEADSGVDYTHPDLAANVWTNPGAIGGCPAGTHGANIVAGTCDPMDDETQYGGHGTHVAGILGAVGNNGRGVAGMNWSTSILPVKWLDSSGYGSTSQLIAALDWFVRAKQAGVNIRVINESATFVGTAYSQALSDEIDVLAANDILFVTAAGNTGDDNDNLSVRRYPCGYDRPNEICVTASDSNDRLPSWANYGATTVDLAAPGDNVYSTLRNGGYGYISGGSMASPQVAGAAALILSRGYLSATALRSDLLGNVDALPALAGKVRTGGRLDVCKALPGCAAAAPAAATFGQTSVGPSTDVITADRKRVNRYSLPTAGTVTRLSAYLQPTGATGQQLFRGVVYADSGGAPGRLLAATSELTFHSTDRAGWYDLPLVTPASLGAGTYWIGLISGQTARVAAFRWSSVAGSRAYDPNSYTSGPSDPFGAPSTDSEQMSLYATYTPSSAGGTQAPTTLGKTGVGASSDSFAADRKRVNRYAVGGNGGTLTDLRMYLQPTGVTGQQVLRGVVYADSGGSPGARLGTSDELTFHSTDAPGWYKLSLPSPPKVGAGNVWLGVITGPSGNVAGFRWDAVTGSRAYNGNAYSAGPSDPFGPSSGTDAEQTSLYATFAPAP